MSHQSFADLGVSKAVCDALHKRGFASPFAVQQLVIEPMLAGRDVLVQSPTGSGKTLAFGIPLIDNTAAEARRPSALVLAPTRELALQIVEELRTSAHSRALRITAVYGGAGLHKQAADAKKAHILVATPGRLEDLLERRAVSLENVKLLVLDEADRMLDLGFRPAVDRIVKLVRRDRQTVVCSATLEGEPGRIALEYTTDAVRCEYDPPAERHGTIEHRFNLMTHEGKVARLVDTLATEDRGRTLVFVRTKRGADRLTKKLMHQGVTAVAMHGDRSQAQRERALAQFDSGKVQTLVATDVAARGIDVRDITHVINYDMPGQEEDYVHRTGRTARAGASGIAITFVTHDQAGEFAKMVRDLDLDDQLAAGGIDAARSGPGSHGARSGGGRPRPGGRGQGNGNPRNHKPRSSGGGHGSSGGGGGSKGKRPGKNARNAAGKGSGGGSGSGSGSSPKSVSYGRPGGNKRRRTAA